MRKYLDQLQDFAPREGQKPSELLAIRVNLIARCVRDFYKKRVGTHKEELGPLVDGEASQLYEEHMYLFTNRCVSELTDPDRESATNANYVQGEEGKKTTKTTTASIMTKTHIRMVSHGSTHEGELSQETISPPLSNSS